MAEKEIDRKVAIILATDVVNYSKHMEANESETVKNLRACELILQKVIKKHDGRLFNSGGDSFFIEFPSAVEAVECAVAFQTDLKKRNSSDKITVPLEFRIGISMGDVIKEKENLLGDGVNIAARLEALAQTNGITISKNIYDLVKAKTSHQYNDLGIQKVKKNEFHAYDILLDPSQKRKLKTTKKKIYENKLLLLIIPFLIIGFYFFYNFQKKQQLTISDSPIILVKPFKDLTSSPTGEASISDAVTETIINNLQRYSEITVLSVDSSYHIKKENLNNEVISQKFSVNFIVNGSAQRFGEDIRVTSELTDLKINKVVWAEKFDFKITDLFKMQDTIGNKILNSVSTNAVMGKEGYSDNFIDQFTSIDDYLLQINMRRYLRQISRDGWYNADELYQQMKNNDNYPPLSLAVMGGWRSVVKIFTGIAEDKKAEIKEALRLNNKGLEIDENYPPVLTQRAFIEANLLKNCENAVSFSEKAMVNGTYDFLVNGLVFFGCGQFEKGLKMFEDALKSTPHDTDLRITKNLMAGYLAMGKYDKAINHGESKKDRNDGLSYVLSAYAHYKSGNEKEAKKLLEKQKYFDKKMDKERFQKEFATFVDRDFINTFFEEMISLGLE